MLLSAAVVCAVCGVAGGWCMGRDGKTISTLAPSLSLLLNGLRAPGAGLVWTAF